MEGQRIGQGAGRHGNVVRMQANVGIRLVTIAIAMRFVGIPGHRLRREGLVLRIDRVHDPTWNASGYHEKHDEHRQRADAHRIAMEQAADGGESTHSVERMAYYGEGMYVMVDGPGFVSFKLNHLVKSLFFGLWSPNGTTGTVHARYFGDNGNTFEAFDYPVVQTGQFVYFIAPAKGIAGVEISRNASSPQHVCVDNFSTFDEEQLERVKALKKTSLTIDDILNIRR